MFADTNKAIVAAGYDGFSRGDLEPITSSLAEDVVWTNHATSAAPHSGQFNGPAGVQKYFESLDAIEITKLDMHSILAEGDRVVALGDIDYKVKSTGKASSGPLVHVFTLTDGKITTFDEFEHAQDGLW